MSCLSFEHRQYTRCHTAGEDKNNTLASGNLSSKEISGSGRFSLSASFKNVPGSTVEIISSDQLAQAHLTEIVLKVKIKFEMPLKRQSILALICHKFIDTCHIFQVSQTRADSLSVVFLPSPNPLFSMMLCNQGDV